jgi:hypothetical protein
VDIRVKDVWRTTRGRLAIGSVAVVSAAGAIFGGALPAQAATSPTAVLNCVQVTGQGLVAFWGYNNPTSAAVSITAPGANNFFQPSPAGRGQPSTLNPGEHDFVFSVSFPSNSTLTWNLAGAARSASSTSPVCGTPGPQGPAGPAGPAGPTGPAGADGATGPAGPAGADGAAGPTGPAGADGATGPAGPSGKTGPAGKTGAPGKRGPAGKAGKVGKAGKPGPAGSLRVVGKRVRLIGPATNATATATAKCPANTSLIGGGVKILHFGNGAVAVVGSNYPSSQRIWTGTGVALSLPGKDIMTVTAYALCTLRT